MSLRREIRKILEAKSGVDSEYLEGASPALLPDGSTAGGLVFVASKDDSSEPPRYDKGDHFTLLSIGQDPSGKKVVQMSRSADGATLTLPASAPFKLYGSQLKKDREDKSKDKQIIDKGVEDS